MRRGLLLINLGTPKAPTAAGLRPYLRRFLDDPRLIDLPTPLRKLLVHAIIVPFRAPKSAAKYAEIWTNEGSPLDVHTRALTDALQRRLGEAFDVRYAYAVSDPGIAETIEAMLDAGLERIHVLPLYPQTAAATTGSALEQLYRALGEQWKVPAVEVLRPFYADEAWVRAMARHSAPQLEGARHVLFSFHGLPESHVQKARGGANCQADGKPCCAGTGAMSSGCYRAQCAISARRIAEALGLAEGSWTVSFQSRLGRQRWLEPSTDSVLEALGRDACEDLAVLCPSFIADCLETLEEIAGEVAETFREAGGGRFRYVTCLNASDGLVEAIAGWVSA